MWVTDMVIERQKVIQQKLKLGPVPRKKPKPKVVQDFINLGRLLRRQIERETKHRANNVKRKR
jgi:hypothetical protein